MPPLRNTNFQMPAHSLFSSIIVLNISWMRQHKNPSKCNARVLYGYLQNSILFQKKSNLDQVASWSVNLDFFFIFWPLNHLKVSKKDGPEGMDAPS